MKFSVMRALQLPAKRKRRWEKRCIWCNQRMRSAFRRLQSYIAGEE